MSCVCPPSLYHEGETDYYLPYRADTAHWMIQGNFGPFGHEYELDFEMPEGTEIVAARAGVVSNLMESCPNCSCWFVEDCACCGLANFVVIDHGDGTYAVYAHLQLDGVLVDLGEPVERGQPIALSGNTGNSTFPHLHFAVAGPGGGRLGPSPEGTMEISFVDVCGDGVPLAPTLYFSRNR